MITIEIERNDNIKMIKIMIEEKKDALIIISEGKSIKNKTIIGDILTDLIDSV